MPQYEAGDRVVEDIVTPIALAVTDYKRTDQIRQEAANKIPSVFRFHAAASSESERALRQAFAMVRTQFGDSLELAAKRRVLDERTVLHPSFERYTAWFEARHPTFPMTPALARLWARQASDEAILTSWVRRLNRVMDQCIHEDVVPPEMAFGPEHVRIVPVDSPQELLTAKRVDHRGVEVQRSNLHSRSNARIQLEANEEPSGLPSPDLTKLAAYLAGFLKPNCFPEEALTREIRESHIGDLWAVDRYEPGEVLARRGQLLDDRAKAAIDLLRSEQKPTGTVAAAVVNSPKLDQSGWASDWKRLAGDPIRMEALAWWGMWALGGISLAASLVLALMVRRKRAPKHAPQLTSGREDAYTVILNPQRNETIFLPVKDATGTAQSEEGVQDGSPESTAMRGSEAAVAADRFWRQRAFEAERRAEDILKLVRAGLAPQLAKQMMNKLVQELISQRTNWLKTQQIVEHDLTEIERRFVKSHAQLQDRLRAFEKRTDQLEHALAVKTEENTELIKTHIAMAQQKLKPKQSDEKEVLWN